MLHSAGRSIRAAGGVVSAAAHPGGRKAAKLPAAAAPGAASHAAPVTAPSASLVPTPSSRPACQPSCVASTEGGPPPRTTSEAAGTSGP